MSSTERKVAMITGASSGIGKASAIALSNAGWAVILFARRVEELKQVQDACGGIDNAVMFVGDVTNEDDVEMAFKLGVQTFGGQLILNCIWCYCSPTYLHCPFTLQSPSTRMCAGRLDLLFNVSSSTEPVTIVNYSDITLLCRTLEHPVRLH